MTDAPELDAAISRTARAMTREPVEIAARRSMTPARKRRIWEREKGKCWICTRPVDPSGPRVVYDHRIPKEISGSDDDAGIYPIHAAPCNKIKTAADIARIAKVRRQAKMDEPREQSRLQGRGFDKTKTRGFDGKVRART